MILCKNCHKKGNCNLIDCEFELLKVKLKPVKNNKIKAYEEPEDV
jgi:hypothetical protein